MKKLFVWVLAILVLFILPISGSVRGQEESPSPTEIVQTPTPLPNPTPTLVFEPTITQTPTSAPEPSAIPEQLILESTTIIPEATPLPSIELTVTPEPTPEIVPPPDSGSAPQPIPTPAPPKPIPGRVVGEGTFFEITDSEYLNVSLTSSTDVKVLFESVPAVITLNIDSLDAPIAELTFRGLIPQKIYHLYVDDFHNHTAVTADENGEFIFSQDISRHRLIMIQERPSTKYIDASSTGRDCPVIGTWNNGNKTCTLNKDVNETIQIDAGNITLDGNGYKMTGSSGISNAVYFKSGVSGSKVKNLTISGFSYAGLNFYQSTNNTVDNVTVAGAGTYGILISYNSNGNTISNSRFINGGGYGTQLYQSGNNTFNNNLFSGNSSKGVYLYQGSHGNTFTNNQITENKSDGVDLSGANNNIFTGNNISYSLESGIYFGGSNNNNNEFRDNIISKNFQYGVEGYYYNPVSTGNIFEHNLIFDHAYYGIYGPPGTNTYRNNVLINNGNAGIQIMGGDGNEVSGNLVTGSSYGLYIGTSNNWIFNNSLINNNYYGIYLQPGSTGSSGNSITNNKVVNSVRGIGIYAASPGAHNNIVAKNLVTNNSAYGMLMLGTAGQANNNQIFNNDFVTNINQAYISIAGSLFNQAVPVGGNFWSNWTTPDGNNDGFVDNLYNLAGGVGARDNFPWTKQHGWLNFITTDNNPIGWQKNDFTITLNCKDKSNISCDQTSYGLDRIWQNGTSININTEGAHLVEYYSRHNGANEELRVTHALLDKTPPQITGAPKLPPVWNNWYNFDVTVVFKATDSLSGVNTFNSQMTVATEGVNQSATTTATDKAGNSGSFTVSGINIDKTGPVTTATYSGDHGSGNWYKSDVTVSLSAVDAGAGVNRIEYSFDKENWITYAGPFTVTTPGLNTFYYRAIDNLGNIEAVSKTSTTLFSDGFYNNYNPANWPDATFLPWFIGRPATLANGGIGTGGKTYYGLNMRSNATGAQSSKRWGIATSQTFSAGPDLFLEYAFMPMNAQSNSGLTEIYLYDVINNKYIKFAANYFGYSSRPAEVEISGLDTRTSGHLHNQYEWLLFRIESRLGKTKFSVIDGADTVRWTTTYDTQIDQILDTFKIAFSQSAISTSYDYSAQNLIDDLKLIKTDYVFRSAVINIDKTLPTISGALAGTSGANDWYVSDVTASLSATDNGGVAKIEYSYDNTNWQTYTNPFILTASGLTTLYYRAVDLAGNIASSSKEIKIDKIAPTTVISLNGTLGNNNWYRSDVLVTLTAGDNEGGLGANPTEYKIASGDWQTYGGPVTIITDGITALSYRSHDIAGNQEAEKIQEIKIDQTPPEISGAALTSPNVNGWYKDNVMVHFTASDSASGVDSVTSDTTLANEGSNQSAVGTAVDKAGNMSEFTLSGINIDKTPPVFFATISPDANSNGWHNTDVSVGFNCLDGLSGLMEVTPTELLSFEGINQSVSGSCTDLAGNSADIDVTGINIDKTAPSVTGEPLTTPNINGWYKDDVTVHFEGSDALSGIETVSPDATVTTAGADQTMLGSATDKAGNTGNGAVVGINIDKTLPVITGSRNPLANINGWNNEDVIVHFECTDILSDVDSVTPDQIVSTEGAGQSRNGVCVDKAGNENSSTVNNINIDKTAAIITGTPLTSPNINGWYKDDVTVHFDGSDALSGVDTISPDKTITTEGKNQSVAGAITDKAGNINSITVDNINLDKTPPVIVIAAPVDGVAYLLHQTVTANWNLGDALSGIGASWGTVPSGSPIDTSSVGPKVFTVTAEDLAGNSIRKDISYGVAYIYSGVLQPVNNDGLSIFKLGRVVPIKFKLTDRIGINISNATARLYLAKISNSVIGTEIEADSSGNANDGNLFRFDPSGNQYIFNLGTKSFSKGAWQLRIELDDGSSKFVIVSFQ